MTPAIEWPNIDPRIKAVGTAHLRKMNAKTLAELADDLYLIHEGTKPLAVLIAYEQFMLLQKRGIGHDDPCG